MISNGFISFFKRDYIEGPETRNDEIIVINKYGEIFHPDNLENLEKEQFHSFLMFRNNRHWNGLQRVGPFVMKNMNRLKSALDILLDEKIEIIERLNILGSKKGNYIPYLDKGILTPILLVVYPEKYGVYNTRSYKAMKELNLFEHDPKEMKSFGEVYNVINENLKTIALKMEMSLWQLDYFWWYYQEYYDSFIQTKAIDIDEPPETLRDLVSVLRVIRDTKISIDLKKMYKYKCQICKKRINISQNDKQKYYAEAHHLKPLALRHNGPDTTDNILILCPNHHVEFDYNVIAIDPNDGLTILHKQKDNPYHYNQIELKHKINNKYLKYHFKIFKES